MTSQDLESKCRDVISSVATEIKSGINRVVSGLIVMSSSAVPIGFSLQSEDPSELVYLFAGMAAVGGAGFIGVGIYTLNEAAHRARDYISHERDNRATAPSQEQ
jgi:hypothetical protein